MKMQIKITKAHSLERLFKETDNTECWQKCEETKTLILLVQLIHVKWQMQMTQAH